MDAIDTEEKNFIALHRNLMNAITFTAEAKKKINKKKLLDFLF